MQRVSLGETGMMVSRLGAGLAEVGLRLSKDKSEQAGRVLNAALDKGINFLDTAACYGHSEEIVGQFVSERRDEYYLATKAGHVTGEYNGAAWAYQTVIDSIDRSLRRMRTDHVDLVQLHSCDVNVLEQGEVIKALQDAQTAGKTRFIGYSGDNDAAAWAVNSGLFATLQTSFNVVDQDARTCLFTLPHIKHMGVIIKRPIANGVWGLTSSPNTAVSQTQRSDTGKSTSGIVASLRASIVYAGQVFSRGPADPRVIPYAAEYYKRALEIEKDGPIIHAPEDRILTAFGFIMAHPEVDTAIIGTTNPIHVSDNVQLMDCLPIPDEAILELQRRFDDRGKGWHQLT